MKRLSIINFYGIRFALVHLLRDETTQLIWRLLTMNSIQHKRLLTGLTGTKSLVFKVAIIVLAAIWTWPIAAKPPGAKEKDDAARNRTASSVGRSIQGMNQGGNNTQRNTTVHSAPTSGRAIKSPQPTFTRAPLASDGMKAMQNRINFAAKNFQPNSIESDFCSQRSIKIQCWKRYYAEIQPSAHGRKLFKCTN